jgi:abhydrolase domain-containing protein 14
VAHLAERNVGSVAVDLPGYGGSAPNDTERGRFLRDLVDELGIENPVLVAPSMSGSYALPALDQDPTRYAGFVPVAPVGVDDFETLPSEEAPTTMIVWGANDNVIPPSVATTLSAKVPNSWIEKIPDAGHAVMDDQPKLFADLLSSFVAALEPLL